MLAECLGLFLLVWKCSHGIMVGKKSEFSPGNEVQLYQIFRISGGGGGAVEEEGDGGGAVEDEGGGGGGA
ncbi:hypothetical protein Tco_1440316 [Tanacetum coccineum]